jgi:hypothetical protein
MMKKRWKDYINLLIKLGVSMAFSILFCFFISYNLVQWFNLFSGVIVIGTFVGVLLGFYLVYLQLKRFF